MVRGFNAYLSAKSGMNVNLLSRGGGFEYIGASLTSFIYATNFIMYCALEGLTLVAAVHEFFPVIPEWALILFFGFIVIPLNDHLLKQVDLDMKCLRLKSLLRLKSSQRSNAEAN